MDITTPVVGQITPITNPGEESGEKDDIPQRSMFEVRVPEK
jgi:hypothetical protein